MDKIVQAALELVAAQSHRAEAIRWASLAAIQVVEKAEDLATARADAVEATAAVTRAESAEIVATMGLENAAAVTTMEREITQPVEVAGMMLGGTEHGAAAVAIAAATGRVDAAARAAAEAKAESAERRVRAMAKAAAATAARAAARGE